VRRPLVRLLVELVALSLPLTWLWLAWGQGAYEAFFAETARPLLAALGATSVPDSPARRRFVSYVPFLVLMLVTPGLPWRRRLGGILLGVPLVFLAHVGLVAVEALSHTRHRPTEDSFSTVFPAAVFADAFPFVLWALFANDVLRRLLARATSGASQYPDA
jgi:hypothetical protein